jgi:hypothetical protein
MFQMRAENEVNLLVERNTRIARLVHTRDLHSRSWLSSSAALNLKLEALDVELRLADVALVEANMLNANKVLARGDVLLHSPLQAILLPAVPGCVDAGSRWVLEPGLGHLDPIAGAIVGLDGAGGFGDIDEAWAGMLDELVVEDLDTKSVLRCSVSMRAKYLEAELVTSLDGVGGSVASDSTLVAAKVVAVHQLAGQRWVVAVGVLASVRILATNGLSVDDQAVEDVMRVGTEGRKQREESNCLDHFEKMRRSEAKANGSECKSE